MKPAAIRTLQRSPAARSPISPARFRPTRPASWRARAIWQAEQVFKNLRAAVKAAGGTMADIIKMNVYLVAEVGADEVPKFRAVRDRYVNVEKLPASTLVAGDPAGAAGPADRDRGGRGHRRLK